MLGGLGPPAKDCGLVRCGFRPSDDACTFPFLIPANAMASVELKHLGDMLQSLDVALSEECTQLGNDLDQAILKHALFPKGNARVFAYEVDGFGNAYFMDVHSFQELT